MTAVGTTAPVYGRKHMNIREIEHMWKVASNNPNHDTNWHDPVVVAFAKMVVAQRQWVGLTNKDIIEMWPQTSTVGWDDIRLIEAKLKEKNT